MFIYILIFLWSHIKLVAAGAQGCSMHGSLVCVIKTWVFADHCTFHKWDFMYIHVYVTILQHNIFIDAVGACYNYPCILSYVLLSKSAKKALPALIIFHLCFMSWFKNTCLFAGQWLISTLAMHLHWTCCWTDSFWFKFDRVWRPDKPASPFFVAQLLWVLTAFCNLVQPVTERLQSLGGVSLRTFFTNLLIPGVVPVRDWSNLYF